jgi:hypothetical protein
MLDDTMDKSVLKQADTQTLIETALECARLQADILTSNEDLTEEELERLIEIESLRDYVVHLINWPSVSGIEAVKEPIEQLQALDVLNRKRLEKRRAELIEQIDLLKKRRNVAGKYMSFR